MTGRDFSDYSSQEVEEAGHRHPGRAPVRREEWSIISVLLIDGSYMLPVLLTAA